MTTNAPPAFKDDVLRILEDEIDSLYLAGRRVGKLIIDPSSRPCELRSDIECEPHRLHELCLGWVHGDRMIPGLPLGETVFAVEEIAGWCLKGEMSPNCEKWRSHPLLFGVMSEVIAFMAARDLWYRESDLIAADETSEHPF